MKLAEMERELGENPILIRGQKGPLPIAASWRKTALLCLGIVWCICGRGSASRLSAADIYVSIGTYTIQPRNLTVFRGDQVIWRSAANLVTFIVAGLEGEFVSPPLRAPVDAFAFTYTKTGVFAFETWWVEDAPPHAPRLPSLWTRGVIEVVEPDQSGAEVFLNSPTPGSSFLIYTNQFDYSYSVDVPVQTSVEATNGLVRMEYSLGPGAVTVATNWPFGSTILVQEEGLFPLVATAVYETGRRVTSPARMVETQKTGEWRGRLGVPLRERDGLLLVPYQLPKPAGRWHLRGSFNMPLGSEATTNGIFEAYLGGLGCGRFPILPVEKRQFLYLDQRF